MNKQCMHIKACYIIILLLLFPSCVNTAQKELSVNRLPVQVELPDPLVRENGRRIKKSKHWATRQSELLDMMLGYEYGTVPYPPTMPPTAKVIETGLRFDEVSKYTNYQLSFGHNEKLTTTLHLYTPNDGKATHPVIVRFGLGGEHARAANERGYAFACFDQTSLDPDTEGHDVVGSAQAMYPAAEWGSLAVWAWGASRVLDYLETREDIDTERAVITGHSRTGKVALLAGAMDERFAIVVPNGSGAGGVSTFRGSEKGVETLELITRESRFKSWFHEDFGRFGNAVNKLPFDQHFMRALVAPRVILSTDAYGDQWCNPKGVQLGWEGAQPVFDLLGVPENNLIHFREGGHDQLAPDFEVLLDVADAHFNNQPFPKSLRKTPFPK